MEPKRMTLKEMAEKYQRAIEAHRAYYQRTREARLEYQRLYDKRKRAAAKKAKRNAR